MHRRANEYFIERKQSLPFIVSPSAQGRGRQTEQVVKIYVNPIYVRMLSL